MPFSGDTFTKLYNWLTDPQRNEKIFNSRLDDEFGGVATGLSALGVRSSALETAVAGLGGGTAACFSAHKNGTDQTGVADQTLTQVTFSTEVFDVGSHFASSAWTPPAGKVLMVFSVLMTGTITTGSRVICLIYKNGAQAFDVDDSSSNNVAGSTVVAIDNANGSDVYTAYIYVAVAAGTATILGTSTVTYFSGTVL